jgi:hypothetical protein
MLYLIYLYRRKKWAMKIKDLVEELIDKTPNKDKLSKKDLKTFSKKVADRVMEEVKKAMIKRASEDKENSTLGY